MSLALVVVTDGRRSCLELTMRSAHEMVGLEVFDYRILINDSLDGDYQRWLERVYGAGFEIQHPTAGKRGFSGAVRSGWAALRASGATWALWLEDDFTFNRPVDLAPLAQVLEARPYLTQLAFLRQPWNDEERAAGGITRMHPGSYVEARDGQHAWREHRRCWTTNPSLFPVSLCDREWPAGAQSEGRFGVDLFASDPDLRAAYWGDEASGEWVTHIGHERVGEGY